MENSEKCENCKKFIQLYYKEKGKYLECFCGLCLKFHRTEFVCTINSCLYYEPKE